MHDRSVFRLPILFILCLALAAGCLSGCEAAPAPEAEPADAPDDAAPASVEVYEAFLQGEGTAMPVKDMAGLKTGTPYSFQEMTEACCRYLADESLPGIPGGAAYALIDCGADGEPELAIQYLLRSTASEEDFPYIQYFILKRDGNTLRVVAEAASYERSEVSLNEYGYLFLSGSSGANSHDHEVRFVNAAGQDVFVYSYHYLSGLDKPIIPSFFFRDNLLPDEYQDAGTVEDDGGYSVSAYSFTAFSENMTAREYDAYKAGFFFSVRDANGFDTKPYEAYARLYKKLNMHCYSVLKINSLLTQHERELGLTEEIKDGGMPDWDDLDITTFSPDPSL